MNWVRQPEATDTLDEIQQPNSHWCIIGAPFLIPIPSSQPALMQESEQMTLPPIHPHRPHPALVELAGLGLPPEDHALFGSGPLLVRGWINEVGDLDVIARGAAWDLAKRVGRIEHFDTDNLEYVVAGDYVTIGTRWLIGDFDIDQLIDTAEVINGVRCVLLRHIVAYKRIADRPKDRSHLAVLAQHGGAI